MIFVIAIVIAVIIVVVVVDNDDDVDVDVADIVVQQGSVCRGENTNFCRNYYS